jgi:hypothetical protein
MRFQDIKAVIGVLDNAYDEGVKSFMCTTHDRIAQVCDHMRADPVRYKDFKFMPCMPYAHNMPMPSRKTASWVRSGVSRPTKAS